MNARVLDEVVEAGSEADGGGVAAGESAMY